jgi:hypothetical protein
MAMGMEFTWISERESSTMEKHRQRTKAIIHAARFSHRVRRQGETKQKTVQKMSLQKQVESLPTRASDTDESVLELSQPKLSGPVFDNYTSIGLRLSASSQRVFDFMRTVYHAECILTDGPNTSPWLSRNLTEFVCRLTLSNIHDSFSQAIEDLPYAATFEKSIGGAERDSHALQCKVVALQGARNALQDTDNTGDLDSVIAILMKLFGHAASDCHVQNARLHGRMLQIFLLRKVERDGISAIDEVVIAYILQHDQLIAQCSGIRTIFDVDYWASACEKPATQRLVAYLQPSYDAYIESLHLHPVSPSLSRLRVSIHHWLWLWCIKAQDGLLQSMNDQFAVVTYFVREQAMFQCQLNNYFVDLRDEILLLQPGSQDDRSLFLHTEVVLTLSILTYLATFTGNPSFGRIYPWPKGKMLLTQLQTFLYGFMDAIADPVHQIPGSKSAGDDAQTPSNNKILLYAFWCGATWEQRGPSDSQNITKSWFKSRFLRQARDLGVFDWKGAKAILDQFCCCDHARPSGEVWVDAALVADRQWFEDA